MNMTLDTVDKGGTEQDRYWSEETSSLLRSRAAELSL
jgi:hypothetical protein